LTAVAAARPAPILAAAPSAAAPVRAAPAEPPGEEAPAPWPSPAEEAAFLGGPAEAALPAPPLSAMAAPVRATPPLEELIQRIPAELRGTLEELFRARYTAVRRIPPEALQK
jgi:hypothetical protein